MNATAENRIEILHGYIKHPKAMEALKGQVLRSDSLTGFLMTGYPVEVDAVLVSAEGQVTTIDLCEGIDPGDYRSRQDNMFLRLSGMLQVNPRFTDRRTPKIKVQTITLAVDIVEAADHPEHPLANMATIAGKLEQFQKSPPQGFTMDEVVEEIMRMPPVL